MARFEPGRSGNPGGRPRGRSAARQVARDHAGSAIFALARVCCDTRASPAEQARAARTLLTFGFGWNPKEAAHQRGRGRWSGLRSCILDLVDQLDREHATVRRGILAELGELEHEEGLTELPPDWTEPF